MKESKHSEIKLDLIERVNGAKHLRVEGDAKEYVRGRKTTFVDMQYQIMADEVLLIESNTSLTLACAGNFIKLDKSGVTIVGNTVKINSGGTAVTPNPDNIDNPEAPRAADMTEYGRNTRYTTNPAENDQLELETIGRAPEDSDEHEPSWIEIELVDELGRPVPNEEYEITTTEGDVRTGRLNAKGQARVALAQPETCQISFPKLDAAVWERA